MKNTFLTLIFASHSIILCAQQTKLKGIVKDQWAKPLNGATVFVGAFDLDGITNAKGEFSLILPVKNYGDSLLLSISYVGKKSAERWIDSRKTNENLSFVLKDNSLTLEEINVNQEFRQNKNSVSSIVFNEEAIERVQAFSLMDVLNTLPGKQMTAPNINAPQTLNLRNTLDGSNTLNNSLGIPIIIDGVRLSNDANMQSRPVGQRGMEGSVLSAVTSGNAADVPFRGVDLREIPVESIEKIEVIQGVASAEYGELTDGAILIERKAGNSPLHFTTNINDGSRNYSLNKGFSLPKNWGGITTDLNYAISNSNPQDKVQEYKRYGTSLRWNTAASRKLRNKLSLDFNMRIDDAKQDPDDNSKRKYYSKEIGVRFSNTTQLNYNTRFFDEISLMFSYSISKQESFAQWLLNSGNKPYTAKDTTGIYEGIILNSQYLAEEEIIGKPITASTSLKFTKRFQIGKTVHSLLYGFNGSYANNGGRGIISDPDRPRFVNFNNQNIRPYSFELNPALINTGFYVTDNFHYKLLGKNMNSNFGVRFDNQNGSTSFQPRLNTRIVLDKRWALSAAFGVATKSPTLAHRYPSPSWIDIPLIIAQNTQSSLYLVYTEKFITKNENLKSSKSESAEFNIEFKNSWITSRINFYYKNNKNGFNSVKVYKPFHLPVFDYHYDEGLNQIVYQETGKYIDYYDKGYNRIENIKNSSTYGFDWSLAFREIKSIRTSFSTSTSYILSNQDDKVLDIMDLSSPVQINGQPVSYLLYQPRNQGRHDVLTSKLNTTTHIPSIGFVIMTNTDIFWKNRYQRNYNDNYRKPVGYLDANMRQVLINDDLASSLPMKDLTFSDSKQRIIYMNFSVSVAKEISKRIRIAVTAYNTFNMQPISSYWNPNTQQEEVVSYNSPLSITGGISIKL
ncbi:TonB-dependent receptor plug domain-containing protein [Sphingobacterium sp. 2149]|uniref:TonB-dependent receptor n=1 Tax=Sphingobacterium sp. 2149 TaxID=2817763 RepID=UPI001AE7373A|nr:TonB-dependent receptor plug domain-containing protein [Sphingobacterium sp. 2149]MDR6737897.1 outer membrane receptor protein involved in Fe transport [Sphingobacterium sp. 2149]